MSDTIRLRVPFAGFYCSVHDMICDDQLAMINMDDHGDEVEVLSQSNVDWRVVRLAYVQAYIAEISEAIELPMSFGEMTSPKFYNFETDAIYADIPRSAFDELHMKTMLDPDLLESFRSHVHDALERRSGFIPFYSNDLADWGDLGFWDDVQKSVLIDHHAVSMELDEADIAGQLSEKTYNAIWSAVIDESKVKYLATDDGPSL